MSDTDKILGTMRAPTTSSPLRSSKEPAWATPASSAKGAGQMRAPVDRPTVLLPSVTDTSPLLSNDRQPQNISNQPSMFQIDTRMPYQPGTQNPLPTQSSAIQGLSMSKNQQATMGSVKDYPVLSGDSPLRVASTGIKSPKQHFQRGSIVSDGMSTAEPSSPALTHIPQNLFYQHAPLSSRAGSAMISGGFVRGTSTKVPQSYTPREVMSDPRNNRETARSSTTRVLSSGAVYPNGTSASGMTASNVRRSVSGSRIVSNQLYPTSTPTATASPVIRQTSTTISARPQASATRTTSGATSGFPSSQSQVRQQYAQQYPQTSTQINLQGVTPTMRPSTLSSGISMNTLPSTLGRLSPPPQTGTRPHTSTVSNTAGGFTSSSKTTHHTSAMVGTISSAMNDMTTGSTTIGQQLASGSTTTKLTGQHTILGTNTYIDESRVHVINERVTETEVRVPKRILREDIIEKVIIVPERQMREELIEEIVKVRQRVIELAKPIIQETLIEVPEIEYIERIVEVPEVMVQEKIREVFKPEYQERVIEVPVIVTQEKVVEVPQYEYIDVPYEKIVEVPEIREQVVVKEIPVPQYVERPYPNYVDVEIEREVIRQVPVPVEAITHVELKLPLIRPRYTRVDVPLYVPRFIEVAVPIEMMDEQMVANADHYAAQVHFLASQSAASLCELERLGGTLKNTDLSAFISAFKTTNEMCQFFDSTWTSGRLSVVNTAHLNTNFNTVITTTTVESSATTSTTECSGMKYESTSVIKTETATGTAEVANVSGMSTTIGGADSAALAAAISRSAGTSKYPAGSPKMIPTTTDSDGAQTTHDSRSRLAFAQQIGDAESNVRTDSMKAAMDAAPQETKEQQEDVAAVHDRNTVHDVLFDSSNVETTSSAPSEPDMQQPNGAMPLFDDERIGTIDPC